MELESLPNIGTVLAKRLRSVEIPDAESLQRLGATRAFSRIAAEYGPKRPPLCYNLYSLEAALRGHDWRLLDEATKRSLRESAGVEHRIRSEGKRASSRPAARRDSSR